MTDDEIEVKARVFRLELHREEIPEKVLLFTRAIIAQALSEQHDLLCKAHAQGRAQARAELIAELNSNIVISPRTEAAVRAFKGATGGYASANEKMGAAIRAFLKDVK
jgi:hypothetical protein